MSTRVPLYMHKVAGWEVTNTGMVANQEQLQSLETLRVSLEERTTYFKTLFAQFGALTTSKQEMVKEMQEVFRQNETLVVLLRNALRQHYGKESEKLIEFGIQPFRGRKSRVTEKPTPEAPAPADPSAAS